MNETILNGKKNGIAVLIAIIAGYAVAIFAFVLAIATGRTAMAITGITLAILAIAAIAVFETKKNVINKSYTNIL